VLDAHDFADALARVDGLVTDLESLHRDGLLTRKTALRKGVLDLDLRGGVA
jgi:hypothetical protein